MALETLQEEVARTAEVNNNALAVAKRMGTATTRIKVGTWVANMYMRHSYACARGAEAGWTLPLASTYIIDKAGMIRHVVTAADWRIRPDPNDTLDVRGSGGGR